MQPSTSILNRAHKTHARTYVIDRCRVLDNHPLNLSDHIPISVSLNKELISCHRPTPQIRLDWRKANTDGLINLYQSELSHHITPILSLPLHSIDDIENEISVVTNIIHEVARSILPHRKASRKVKVYIRDTSLKEMCTESKKAWRQWRDAGRPTSGCLYDNMKK